MPWHQLEPRGIPLLTDRVVPYRQTSTVAAGRCARGYEAWENALAGFEQELRALRWKPAPPGRRTGKALQVEIPPAGKGRLQAVTCDLGDLSAGQAATTTIA